MKLSHRVPIIKAVGDACNLRGDYCFYSGMNQRPSRFMSDNLLTMFLEQYFTLFSGELSFVWHGGEPLLAGIPFYERVLQLQRQLAKVGDVVENKIQTNATLINDNWAEFFKQNKFRVGVSLDGCRVSHDRHRRDVGGRGTFDAVIRGIETLRRHGITPGIIQTVTRNGIDDVDDDFHFFTEHLRVNGWAVNLFAENSSPCSRLQNEGLRDEDVGHLYEKMARFWLSQNNENLYIREIENVAAGVTGRRAKSCSFNGACANYFCLDAEGLVWPCDRLSTDVRHLLGDLRSQTLQEVLEGGAAVFHAERTRQLSNDCVPCRWRSACNNGCTAMRDPHTGTYVYCNARKEMFNAFSVLLNTEPTTPSAILPMDFKRSQL